MMKILLMTAVMITFQVFPAQSYKVTYYGGHHHGRKTASGEIFDKNKLTCASTSMYKFGQLLELTNVKNNKKVIVKVNDRGGFRKYGVHLDLSEAAFKQLAPLSKGALKVFVRKL